MTIMDCFMQGIILFACLAAILGMLWVAMEIDYRIHSMPARRISAMMKRSERRK